MLNHFKIISMPDTTITRLPDEAPVLTVARQHDELSLYFSYPDSDVF
jgi:hypothetical protein